MREKLIIAAIVVTTLHSCAKRNIDAPVPNSSSISMTLHDQPLDTIKRYITGRWQLISAEGGFTGKDKKVYTNSFVNFTSGGSMVWTENGTRTVDGVMKWEQVKNINTGGTTYMMTEPMQWKFDYLYHDSLTASDNHYDGYGYLLIRAQ